MASMPCPVCGTVNRSTSKFCSRCGTSLSGATGPVAPKSQPPAPPAPPPQTTAPVSPDSQPTAPVSPPTTGQIACPKCGKLNRGSAKRCGFCGQILQVMPATPQPLPTPPPAAAPAYPPQPVVVPPPSTKKGVGWASAVLLACLTLSLCGSLFGIFNYENSQPTATPTPTIALVLPTSTNTPPPPPTAQPIPSSTPTATPNPPYPVVALKFTSDGRFGLRTTADPTNGKSANKPLTYRPERTNDIPTGDTNNTRVSVDGKTPLFGSQEGKFLQPPAASAGDSAMSAVWQYGKIVFTQTVQVVLGTSTHRLDTFQISYAAENRDVVSHTVGVRLMIDTLIGDNDGVPFNVPGRGMVTWPLDLRGADIPNFVQVYESPNPNPTDPGVIIQMTLTGGDATAPDRFVISPWCNQDAGWDFLAEVGGLANKTLHQCGDQGKGAKEDKLDSSVGMFFDPKPLDAGETRTWTTFYGLGKIQKEVITSSLSISKPPDSVRVGEEFWIAALVQSPRSDQTVKIDLPSNLELTQNPQVQPLQAGPTLAQVAWRVRAVSPGDNLTITVSLAPENQQVSVSLSVMALPTPTPTTAPATPKPCATSITKPNCP